MFDRVLKDYGRKLEAVVYIDISEQTAINRISKRTYCKKCGTTYHPVFKPSKREGFCDNDGEPLFQRSDDKAEIVKERFKAEMGNTEEVLKEYDKRDIVHRINGEPSIVQIHNTILEMLSNEA
jgi:adenylate kinase